MQDEEKRALESKIFILQDNLKSAENKFVEEEAKGRTAFSLCIVAFSLCFFIYYFFQNEVYLEKDFLGFITSLVSCLTYGAAGLVVAIFVVGLSTHSSKLSDPNTFYQKNPLLFGVLVYIAIALIFFTFGFLWFGDEKRQSENVDPDKIYSQAYNEGYHAGEEAGQYDIERTGYENGYSEGSNEGHSQGYKEGYEDGYEWGYENGYEDCLSDGNPDSYHDGYDDGYNDGYNKASEEFEDYYAAGYEDGHDETLSGEYRPLD